MEAKGLEPSNLLTASQALYQLSYAPGTSRHVTSPAWPDRGGRAASSAPFRAPFSEPRLIRRVVLDRGPVL